MDHDSSGEEAEAGRAERQFETLIALLCVAALGAIILLALATMAEGQEKPASSSAPAAAPAPAAAAAAGKACCQLTEVEQLRLEKLQAQQQALGEHERALQLEYQQAEQQAGQVQQMMAAEVRAIKARHQWGDDVGFNAQALRFFVSPAPPAAPKNQAPPEKENP